MNEKESYCTKYIHTFLSGSCFKEHLSIFCFSFSPCRWQFCLLSNIYYILLHYSQNLSSCLQKPLKENEFILEFSVASKFFSSSGRAKNIVTRHMKLDFLLLSGSLDPKTLDADPPRFEYERFLQMRVLCSVLR